MKELLSNSTDYEIHVTYDIPLDKIEEAKTIAKYFGWHTSRIDGDPLLGVGIKFYYTRHSNSLDMSYNFINTLVDYIGYNTQFKLLRTKIEQIIYDRRY